MAHLTKRGTFLKRAVPSAQGRSGSDDMLPAHAQGRGRFWQMIFVLTHRIHGAAIYGNIYHQYTPNISIYTSTMDPMAKEREVFFAGFYL